MNPIARLFGSRAFLLLLLDVLTGVISYFAAKYAAPTVAEDVKYLIAVFQPVLVVVIGKMGYEDVAKAKLETHERIATLTAASDLEIAKTTGRAPVTLQA